MNYKETLNMPKSGFPMRAGLPMREPEMLRHWEELISTARCSKRTKVTPASPCMTVLRSPTAICTWVMR